MELIGEKRKFSRPRSNYRPVKLTILFSCVTITLSIPFIFETLGLRKLPTIPFNSLKKKPLSKQATSTVLGDSNNDPPLQCMIMTHDRVINQYKKNHQRINQHPYNARMFCRSSQPICLSSHTLYGLPSEPTKQNVQCKLTTASLKNSYPLNHQNCSDLYHQVKCHHGIFPIPLKSYCPSNNDSSISNIGTKKWLDGVGVIIPAYPFLGNIFHFSYVLLTSVNLGRKLVERSKTKKKKLIFIFRGRSPDELGKWQSYFMNSLMRKLKRENISSSIYSFGMTSGYDNNGKEIEVEVESNETICINSGMLLGPRGDVNVWPFPSSIEMNHRNINNRRYNKKLNNANIIKQLREEKRFAIPLESMYSRSAIYDSINLNLTTNTIKLEKRIFTPLPELSISYSRRNTDPDPPPGKTLRRGPVRRLSDSDEIFLINSLKSASTKHNLTFNTIQTTPETSMEDQISSFYKTGILIGLHGANLMNSIFMLPLSVLIEISPLTLPCYVSGSNSGLLSWLVKPERIATPEESNCPKRQKRCWNSWVERRILLDSNQTRLQLQQTLEQSILYLIQLRNTFSKLGKIPLVLDEKLEMYTVDWNFKP